LIALIALMALGGSGLAVGLAGSIALAPAARADDASAWVERQLQAMTTRQKVGQLFVPRVYGTTADTAEPQDVSKNLAELGVANTVELIRRYQVGGIVYFGGNVTTPRALARFGNAVQSAAAGTAVPIGVLTAIDQEQGLVVRVGPPATVLPGSMALGAAGSAQAAELAARITGEELRAMGCSPTMRRLRMSTSIRAIRSSACDPSRPARRWSPSSSPPRSGACRQPGSPPRPSTSPVTAIRRWTAMSACRSSTTTEPP
jgi:hypothetical protein